MVVHRAVSMKTTMMLIGSCVGGGYLGIGLAYVVGAVSECAVVAEIESRKEGDRKARRRAARNAAQTTVAEQERLDDEVEYGDEDPSPLPDWALHAGGTTVRIVAGENQGKEGVLAAESSYDDRSQRYRVTVDGEAWLIPRADVRSTADPSAGARVLVLQGNNAGRVGTVGVKHDAHDLYKCVLDTTEQHPPRVFVVEKEGGGDAPDADEPSWPLAFGEGERARTVARVSGAARKLGLKPGMVVARLNGGEDWGPLDAIQAEALELQLQEGWWLDRSMFDCFPA